MLDVVSNPTNEVSESHENFQPVYEYLLITLGACWFLLIVCELYFGRDLVSVISFRVQDATWLPANVGPSRSLIGLHHFGDFQIWLGYAAIHNPFPHPKKQKAALSCLLWGSRIFLAIISNRPLKPPKQTRRRNERRPALY